MSFFVECGGQKWRLNDGSFVIGRHSDCDLRIADGRLSRHHARLTIAGDRAEIFDLDSRNGIFVDEERMASSVVGPERNVRVGPYRLVMHPMHPEMRGSTDADFVPLSANGATSQALTNTFDSQDGSSAESTLEHPAPAAERSSEAFTPMTQHSIGGSALTAPGWLPMGGLAESSFIVRCTAYLGDVGVQLPLAGLIGASAFGIGLIAAEVSQRATTPNFSDLAHLAWPLHWPELSLHILSSADKSGQALWYLGISCGLCCMLGYLCLVLVIPTLANGAPYWHRHYHLQICTAAGGHPAFWQVALRWALSLPLAPLNLPLLMLRRPGLHDLLAGTRLRSA